MTALNRIYKNILKIESIKLPALDLAKDKELIAMM